MKKIGEYHKRSFDERRRHSKIEGIERLRLGKRRIVLQNSERNSVEMCGARGGPKKVEGST